jgi:hypothetical protein
MGFSQNTCAPAFSAARVMDAWAAGGVATEVSASSRRAFTQPSGAVAR